MGGHGICGHRRSGCAHGCAAGLRPPKAVTECAPRRGRLLPVGRRPFSRAWLRGIRCRCGNPTARHPSGLAQLVANRFRSAVARQRRPHRWHGTPTPVTLDLDHAGDPDTMARSQEPSRDLDQRRCCGCPPGFYRKKSSPEASTRQAAEPLRAGLTTWDAAGGPFCYERHRNHRPAKTAETQSIIDRIQPAAQDGSGPTRLPSERRQRRSTRRFGHHALRVRSEPLHSMSVEMLVDAIGPTMQRYRSAISVADSQMSKS